ncbi:MAG: hypothetical protein ABIR79_15240 [Candidatus Binatia bacterium]
MGAWTMVLVAVALLATPARTRATTMATMPTEAQAVAADRIFVGTVLSVVSQPKADRPKYFETVVRWYVEETVAGTPKQTVTTTFSGGEVGGVRQRVDGMPEIRIGERYVVMLAADQDPPLVSPLIGFNQGLYRVDGVSRAETVVHDRNGRSLAGSVMPAAARGRGGDPTLDDFLAALRAARAK